MPAPGPTLAPTPCNSNSMWKCPLVSSGAAVIWGAGWHPRRKRSHGHPHASSDAAALGPGNESSGLSAGRRDGVHRALTYELTASALVSPLAANSIGHRYVCLNASHKDLKEQGGGWGGRRQGQGPNSFHTTPTCCPLCSMPVCSAGSPPQLLCQVLFWLLVGTCYVTQAGLEPLPACRVPEL